MPRKNCPFQKDSPFLFCVTSFLNDLLLHYESWYSTSPMNVTTIFINCTMLFPELMSILHSSTSMMRKGNHLEFVRSITITIPLLKVNFLCITSMAYWCTFYQWMFDIKRMYVISLRFFCCCHIMCLSSSASLVRQLHI